MLVINKFVTGIRMREARIRSGMTVKEVRAALNIARETTIYEWESGKFLPSIEHFYQLSQLYHTSIEGFLAFEGGESAFIGDFLSKKEISFTAAA